MLIAILVFTAMFLLTLFLVGPFVGGAELEMDILSQQPATFTVEKNILMRTNETKNNLMVYASERGKEDSIRNTIDNVFGERVILYEFEDNGDIETVIFDDKSTHGPGTDRYDEILKEGIMGTPRPVLLPEEKMGATYQIIVDPDEVEEEMLESLTF